MKSSSVHGEHAMFGKAYTLAYPKVQLDIALSDRKIDLVEDGFDLAIRIGAARPATHSGRPGRAERRRTRTGTASRGRGRRRLGLPGAAI